jgi:hypothetical protein
MTSEIRSSGCCRRVAEDIKSTGLGLNECKAPRVCVCSSSSSSSSSSSNIIIIGIGISGMVNFCTVFVELLNFRINYIDKFSFTNRK